MQARKDELTAAKIETARVFERMLGTQDALHYLRAAAVPQHLIARVLGGGECRPPAVSTLRDPTSPATQSSKPGAGFYVSNGRRTDVIKSAVIQAALSLRAELGDERVAQMLRREALPDEVIARVMRAESGSLRARPQATQER